MASPVSRTTLAQRPLRNLARTPDGRVIAGFRAEWRPPPPPPPQPPEPGVPTVLFAAGWHKLEVGWEIAVRAYSRAMRLAGLDIRLPPGHRAVPEVMDEVGHVVMRTGAFDAYVQSSCFGTYDGMRGMVTNLSRQPGKRVLYTMFERRNFDRRIADLLRPLDGVWVPCSWNRQELEAVGLSNAVAFPVPHFPDDPLLEVPPPRENRTFYWVGNWSPRKAPENLVRAFLRAFEPGDARLVLKTGPWRFHKTFPEPEAVVARELAVQEVRENGWTHENWRESVVVDRRALSRRELVSEVHAKGDVYVSASRGEGFDMPAYEAKLAHRRVITTDSGGPRDFLGERDTLIPADGRVPTDRDYGWESYATYADYELGDLVLAMRRVRGEPPVTGRDWPVDRFTAEKVGADLRAWFERLVPSPIG